MPIQVTERGDLIEAEILNGRASLRSSELNEIISHQPSFLIRWGITIFFFILIGVFIGCWFIQYPDIINSTAKLTSINAPKEVKAKIDGKLIKLIAEEGKLVKPFEILGYIESRGNHVTIIALANKLDSISKELHLQPQLLASKRNDEIYGNELGEIQPQYQTFQLAFNNFKQYLKDGFYERKKQMLLQDVSNILKLEKNLKLQIVLLEEDLKLQQETFDANEKMSKEKVISSLDFRTEKSRLIGKKMTLPQLKAALISNESNQLEKKKEIAQLDNEISQQKNIFSEALNTFRVQIEDWKAKYLLIAPIGGNIKFANFLQQNQQLQNNQTVCFINPYNSEYYAEIQIPQNNFGKIKEGEKVLLKFIAYPYQQYGFIEGKLGFVSNIPTDSGYLAKIILPKKLITTYHKEIQYRYGLLAQAEIITDRINLLERFFYQAKSIFSKQ